MHSKPGHVLLVCTLFLAAALGCAARSVTLTGESREALPPSAADKIQIFTSYDEQRYDEIGYVSVSLSGEKTDTILRILKEEAAKIGADAVVNVGLNIVAVSNGFGGTSPVTSVSGMAVKLR